MKKLQEQKELTFALVWIAIYCVLQSLANPLNKAIGIAYTGSAVFWYVADRDSRHVYPKKQTTEAIWTLQNAQP